MKPTRFGHLVKNSVENGISRQTGKVAVGYFENISAHWTGRWRQYTRNTASDTVNAESVKAWQKTRFGVDLVTDRTLGHISESAHDVVHRPVLSGGCKTS